MYGKGKSGAAASADQDEFSPGPELAIMRGPNSEDRVVISRIALSVAALCVAMAASAIELTDRQRADIEARIKPVGEVCLHGDSSCAGAAAGGAQAAARSGEEVYNAACMACHMTGAGGAPITGDLVAWADRIAKGMDALHDVGVNGIAGTSMMAKGGCMSCSDDEVIAAVDYMVENSR
jgi:cytochrome c5